MNVQIMQCPSCGSPLPAPSVGTRTSCTYCGASLEVTKGASGSPMAKLSEIKEDTSFIAKERAKEHLSLQAEVIGHELESLEQSMHIEISYLGRLPVKIGFVVGAACAAVLSVIGIEPAAVIWLSFIVGGFTWVITYLVGKRHEAGQIYRADQAIAEPLAAKRAELAETRAAIQRLEQELNALARRV